MSLLLLTLFFYLAAFVVVFRSFFLERTEEHPFKHVRVFLALGVSLHFLILLRRVFSHLFSILSFADTLFLLAFLLTFALVVSHGRKRVLALYLIVPPMASFLLLCAFVSPSAHVPLKLPSSFPKPLLVVHIASIILSYALFILAFASSVFYLLKERGLKQKSFAASFFALPPLQDLDRVSLRFLLIGFPLLTFGLLLGAFFAHLGGTSFRAFDLKVIFSYLLWLFYGCILFLRLTKKSTGKKGAYLIILGFFVLLFTYLGLNFLSLSWHRYI